MTDLTKLLREAEMQQVNLQTEVQLQKNLAFFKESQPILYNQFSNYTPETLRLLYTEEGYLNLVNYKHNNHPVYQENPADYIQKSIQQYMQHPANQKFGSAPTRCIDEETNAHMSNANKIAALINTQPIEKAKKLPKSINFMTMLGLGLGYQLEELLEATDIKHLCVIEPQADIFYASAHAINWQPIFQHFSQDGHSLELIIGKDQDAYYNQFNNYIKKIGPHNAANPFIYKHLTSKSLEQSIYDLFYRIMPRQVSFLGYFDDEQVGLAHTITNTLNNTPILNDHVLLNKKYLNKPAFIIANGPSLDKAVEFLQANQDKAIIFSCGTALGALTKMGIKPDFHIEQERPRFMLEWIQSAASKEERKGVTLLALNTVHPDVFALFERKAMAMKANDLGTEFVKKHIKPNKKLINFAHCNPTVSNSAVAFASALGFANVYFFGLDLGYPEGDLHHSTLSKHYEIKKSEENTLAIAKPDEKKGLTAPGNFGDKIVTNTIFMTSCAEIEAVIKSNAGMHCFNTSHGVLINGAQPLQIKDLKLNTKAFDKKKYVDKVYQKYFSSRGVLKKFTPADVKKVFKPTAIALSELEKKAKKPVNTYQQGMDTLASLHAHIATLSADPKTQYSAFILRGSIATFTILLAQALSRTNSEKKNIELYNQCLKHFFDFLEQTKTKIESDLLREDVTSHHLEKILTAPTFET